MILLIYPTMGRTAMDAADNIFGPDAEPETVRLVARGGWSASGEPAEVATTADAFARADLGSLTVALSYAYLSNCGCPRDLSLSNFERCCLSDLSIRDRVHTEIQGGNTELLRRAPSPLTLDLQSARVFGTFIGTLQTAKTDPTSLRTYLRNQAATLDTAEKLHLLRLLGATFGANYDFERLDSSSPRHDGAVSFEQIMTGAVARFRAFEFGKPLDAASGEPAAAGVCTDIASALGEAAQELGFRNTYVVAYTTKGRTPGFGALGYHATLVFEDPDPHTRQLYQLDYGNLTPQRFHDVRALYQGADDQSLNYRVFRPGGRHVLTVQSDFGKFMTEAAGFDLRNIDPLAVAGSSILGVDVAVDKRRQQHLRAGVGVDGTGARYAFGGTTRYYGQNTWFPGGVGLVVALREGPSQVFLTPLYTGVGTASVEADTATFIYLHLEQGLRSAAVDLLPGLSARIEALASAIFAAGVVDSGWLLPQGDLRLSSNVRIDQGSEEKSRISSTHRAGVQLAPGTTDIRRARLAVTELRPYVNHLFFSSEGRLKLSQSAEGRAFLIAATTVLLDELGPKARAELGVKNEHLVVSFHVQGRLTEGQPLFVDGAQRRAGGSLSWMPTRTLQLLIAADTAIEETPTEKPDVQIIGSAIYRR